MTDSFEKYRDYSLSQFVLDDSFINWVKYTTEERNLFWEGFLKDYPHQTENIYLAKKLVLEIRTEQEIVDEQTKKRIWGAITTQASRQAPVVQMRSRKWLIGVAAAIFIVMASILFLRISGGVNKEVIQTAYGEKRTITLPDNSTVILNAASKVEYKNNWDKTSPREVWIEGEAFLDIVHINKAGQPVQPSERFVVHLKNMDVEVLGTSFTVNTRRNGEQVVLQTGSVKVNVKNNPDEIFLKPGEMVQYSKENNTFTKEFTNAVDHALWKDSRLRFDNTSLDGVIQLIEDTYGYKVIIADSSLLSRTITGTVSSENEKVLFKALETMLDVKMSVSAKTVTISKK
jgi:transmembrane sensor